LQDDALQIYRDHQAFPWLHHVLIGTPDAWCHVIYKRRVFKRLPSAAVLHISNRGAFAAGWRRLSSHLLSRGCISTQMERRMIDPIPWPSAVRSGFNAKLYQSATLRADQIDYLYSEAMALDL